MSASKFVSSIARARVRVLASVLSLAPLLGDWTTSAQAQAVGAPSVALGAPKEISPTQYTISVNCNAPRQSQSCMVQVSTDFAKFTGGNVVMTSNTDAGPAMATLAKDRTYYFRVYFIQGPGGQSLQTSPYSAVQAYKFVPPAPPPVAATPTLPDASALGSTSCGGIKGVALKSGSVMPAGSLFETADKKYQLIYQTDGNLVVYQLLPTRKALWASKTNGQDPGKVVMQADGDLVVLKSDGAVGWSSKTGGNAGAVLSLQDDNNLVVYRKDSCSAAWSRR